MPEAPIRFFSLDSHRALADQIAARLDVEVDPIDQRQFADGEIYLRLEQTVRGADVFVVQTLNDPVNDHLMGLLMFLDAARRASAKSINVIMPYMAYARADRKARSREPISAKLVANLIESQGASRVIVIDLHAPQLQGFFDIPVDHLLAAPILAHEFFKRGLTGDDVVVAAPDHSSASRAEKMAKLLNAQWAIVDRRDDHIVPDKPFAVTGNVADKRVILLDDMIDTGTAMALGAEALHAADAADVTVAATHGLFTDGAVARLAAAPIDALIVTDTMPLPAETAVLPISQITTAPLLASVTARIIKNESVQDLLKSPDNPDVKL